MDGKFKRIVVKIGSSLFYTPAKKLDLRLLDDICAQIGSLVRAGKEIIVVSSGAIALGMSILKMSARPKEIAHLQAAAALGQNELMDAYQAMFKKRSLRCGQILLTWDDFTDRCRYVNAKNTIDTLLSWNAVPVINENDTVSTEEIKFGDNDQLCALVASLVSADLLIVLSDVDGLLDRDKNTVIRKVYAINADILALASSTNKATSVGGMITKIRAAKVAVDSGVPCVIAGGRQRQALRKLSLDPEAMGTLFLPKESGLSQRQRWIAFGARPKASIVVDDGARKAVLDRKSLLAVGVTSFEGAFEAGDVVRIIDRQACQIARGKVSLSSPELATVKGTRHQKEIAHRDDIVVLE